jgi:hypothetical protein
MTDALGLEVSVHRFVDELTPALEQVLAGLPGRDPATARLDVTNEAFNLVCACIDADGIHTDPELWALLKVFAPLLDTPLLRATPADLRDARLLRGRAAWLDTPSDLFGILLELDRRDGDRRARDYYDGAVRIAYLVVALDTHPGRDELLAIERFRGRLLRALDDTPATAAPDGIAESADPTTESTTVSATSDGAAPPASSEARPLDELLAELDALIGLDAVKEEVHLVAALLKVQAMRAARDLPVLETSRHLVFTGNPGTGKTTVARLLAEIFRTLGVVPRGQLVETDRAGLVAGFVGQTAAKVTEVFDRADGGVLLIDEAYALARGGERDFGREAIDTIVKLVEDRRDDIVVIVAGYPDEMEAFVDVNPGLRSRFSRTIHFPDYSTDELVCIFESLCERHGYTADVDTIAAVRVALDDQERGRGFGNGRFVRNLFEASVARHARRVADLPEHDVDDLVALVPTDLPERLTAEAAPHAEGAVPTSAEHPAR